MLATLRSNKLECYIEVKASERERGCEKDRAELSREGD